MLLIGWGPKFHQHHDIIWYSPHSCATRPPLSVPAQITPVSNAWVVNFYSTTKTKRLTPRKPPTLDRYAKPPSIATPLWLESVHTLQWRHNGRDGVSNHQPRDCLLNRLFGRRSKKTPKLRDTGRCVNSPHKWPVTRKMLPFDDVIMGNHVTTIGVDNALSSLAVVFRGLPMRSLYLTPWGVSQWRFRILNIVVLGISRRWVISWH